MRGVSPVSPTSLLLLSLTAGCWGQPTPPASAAQEPTAEQHQPGGAPNWVPAYTPAQTALLAPVERAIKAPAERVFPDLQRFGYANNRPLADAEDAIKFTRMVARVLNDSARFYVLEELPAGASNPIVQYGPAPTQPDGFKVPKRGADGIAELVAAPGADEARAAVARGSELAKGGDVAGAIEAYKSALTNSPRVPALRVALGAALEKAGRTADAELVYREAIAIDPTFAPAHQALAEIADKRNDLPAARRALTEALAYDPSSTRGLVLLRKLVGGAPGTDGGWYDPPAAGAKTSGRVEPFALFLDVDTVGAVHVATAKSDAAQIYGGCRAILRHEPELRAQIFQQPRETPYYLSVAEEVVCLEAALGAYLASKSDKPDADLEQLLRIAREEGLSGYVMFEILGQHRPERARTAPPDVHRDTTAYLEHWVLARRQALPEGNYTAQR